MAPEKAMARHTTVAPPRHTRQRTQRATMTGSAMCDTQVIVANGRKLSVGHVYLAPGCLHPPAHPADGARGLIASLAEHPDRIASNARVDPPILLLVVMAVSPVCLSGCTTSNDDMPTRKLLRGECRTSTPRALSTGSHRDPDPYIITLGITHTHTRLGNDSREGG